jgi:hypothetical protein
MLFGLILIGALFLLLLFIYFKALYVAYKNKMWPWLVGLVGLSFYIAYSSNLKLPTSSIFEVTDLFIGITLKSIMIVALIAFWAYYKLVFVKEQKILKRGVRRTR